MKNNKNIVRYYNRSILILVCLVKFTLTSYKNTAFRASFQRISMNDVIQESTTLIATIVTDWTKSLIDLMLQFQSRVDCDYTIPNKIFITDRLCFSIHRDGFEGR